MTLKVLSVTVDSTDPLPLAQWWADRLDARIVATNDGWFVIVSGGNAPGQLAFQKVDEVTPGKNSWHLDLGRPTVRRRSPNWLRPARRSWTSTPWAISPGAY